MVRLHHSSSKGQARPKHNREIAAAALPAFILLLLHHPSSAIAAAPAAAAACLKLRFFDALRHLEHAITDKEA